MDVDIREIWRLQNVAILGVHGAAVILDTRDSIGALPNLLTVGIVCYTI